MIDCVRLLSFPQRMLDLELQVLARAYRATIGNKVGASYVDSEILHVTKK